MGSAPRHRAIRTLAAPALLALGSAGCRPVLNVEGTYFPASIVSAFVGLSIGYLLVRWLARRPAARPVAQSALFYLSVAAVIGGLCWWSLILER